MSGRLFLLPLFLVAPLYGQYASISIPDQTLNPGQTVIGSLALASAGQSIAAIQFDLQWQPPISLQITAGNQLLAALKQPDVASTASQTLRCLIAGMNQTAIADGELLKVFLSADPSASPASSQIAIANVVAVDPNGMPVAMNGATVNVQIQSGTPGQWLPSNAVLNAASFITGPLSPGEIVTLLGFNGLDGVSLSVNNLPAPILYAGMDQINAIVPVELNPNQSATASLNVRNSSQTQTLNLPVAAVSPAIFTLTGTGLGQGAILNQDYTVNSFYNPALPGSIVMVYGTGFGPLTLPVTDGQAVSGADPATLAVTATVAGQPASVLYAGAAPELIAGVTQINVQLPAGVAHNLSAPLVLTVAGSSTINGVTVAIQ